MVETYEHVSKLSSGSNHRFESFAALLWIFLDSLLPNSSPSQVIQAMFLREKFSNSSIANPVPLLHGTIYGSGSKPLETPYLSQRKTVGF